MHASHEVRHPRNRRTLMTTVVLHPPLCNSLTIDPLREIVPVNGICTSRWWVLLVWMERAPPPRFTINRNPRQGCKAFSDPSIEPIEAPPITVTILVAPIHRARREREPIKPTVFSGWLGAYRGNKSQSPLPHSPDWGEWDISEGGR